MKSGPFQTTKTQKLDPQRFCQNEPIHDCREIAALCSMLVAAANSESDTESDGPPHDKTGTFGNGGHSAILLGPISLDPCRSSECPSRAPHPPFPASPCSISPGSAPGRPAY